jgi:hypothetical protein
VVLNTGGAVLMRWKDGGRLPVTLPAKLDDSPARAAGHPERLAVPVQPPIPVEAGSADRDGRAHSHDAHARFPIRFFVDLLPDGAVRLSACSIRDSSTRCSAWDRESNYHREAGAWTQGRRLGFPVHRTCLGGWSIPILRFVWLLKANRLLFNWMVLN